MKTAIARFLADESGATAVEYGLIAGIIGIGLVGGLAVLRDGLNDIFNNAASNIE